MAIFIPPNTPGPTRRPRRFVSRCGGATLLCRGVSGVLSSPMLASTVDCFSRPDVPIRTNGCEPAWWSTERLCSRCVWSRRLIPMFGTLTRPFQTWPRSVPFGMATRMFRGSFDNNCKIHAHEMNQTPRDKPRYTGRACFNPCWLLPTRLSLVPRTSPLRHYLMARSSAIDFVLFLRWGKFLGHLLRSLFESSKTDDENQDESPIYRAIPRFVPVDCNLGVSPVSSCGRNPFHHEKSQHNHDGYRYRTDRFSLINRLDRNCFFSPMVQQPKQKR
jgi:hypothetical protein